MTRAPISRAALLALFASGVALAVSAGPAGCFYPDYTFDLPEGSGGTTAGAGNGSSSGRSTGAFSGSGSSSGPGAGSTTSTGGATATGTTSSTGGGGAASVSASSASATASSASSVVSSSAGGGTEDCTNGVDDDADGKADCADVKCQNVVSCVAAIPPGATGYYALYQGPTGTDPGCPADFPGTGTSYVGNDGFSASAATCLCTCKAPTGQTCALPNQLDVCDEPCGVPCSASCDRPLSFSAFAGDCFLGEPADSSISTCGGGCSGGASPCNKTVRTSAAFVSGGSCLPNPVQITKPPVSWTTVGHGCGDVVATNTAGCAGGKVCLPKPAAPYVGGVCVAFAGKDATVDPTVCQTPFTQAFVFYKGVADTRSCTNDCGCDPPENSTCGAQVTVYSNATSGTCSNQIASFQTGSCATLASNPVVGSHILGAASAPSGGDCPGTGGSPTGTAQASQPTTFCCLP